MENDFIESLAANDDIVTINSEILSGPAMRYRMTNGREDQSFEWKAKAVTHRTKLFIASLDAIE